VRGGEALDCFLKAVVGTGHPGRGLSTVIAIAPLTVFDRLEQLAAKSSTPSRKLILPRLSTLFRD